MEKREAWKNISIWWQVGFFYVSEACPLYLRTRNSKRGVARLSVGSSVTIESNTVKTRIYDTAAMCVSEHGVGVRKGVDGGCMSRPCPSVRNNIVTRDPRHLFIKLYSLPRWIRHVIYVRQWIGKAEGSSKPVYT